MISIFENAPDGVVSLLYSMNNTQDFENGKFMDNTGTPAGGLNLFLDATKEYIATQTIKEEKFGIAGPTQLKQCPDCAPFFIAQLPIVDDKHEMIIDGKS